MPILTEDERIGTLLAGKYRVRSLLARGGMGVLFEGEHTWTHRAVAIKLLHPSATADATVAQRFLREARAATALRHPHVVDVLDMGEADDGALFMVLELLRGADLGTVRQGRGPLDAKDAVEIVTPIIDALATAHAAGFVHRDIKPSNVFLARQADGSVVPTLLDFGIAKALGDSDTGGTKSGVIVGTPHYMSPEQAEGIETIGPASDVWSLGVLLYEIVSGALPYDAGSPTAILVTILQKAHVPLTDVAPSVPPGLAAQIERALVRAPEDRPLDLRAWAADLRAAAGLPPVALPLVSAVTVSASVVEHTLSLEHFPTEPPPAVAPALARRSPSPATRRPTWIALGATALVLSLVAFVAIAWRASHLTPEPVVRALDLPPAPPSSVPPVAVTPTPAPLAPTPPSVDPAATGAAPPPEAAPPATARPPRPTRPVRVPSGDTSHGRRPITTITTQW